MRYKGMVARHEYVMSTSCFVGEIVNCPDVISFAAPTLAELEQVMRDAVDNYLSYQKQQMRLRAQQQRLDVPDRADMEPIKAT